MAEQKQTEPMTAPIREEIIEALEAIAGISKQGASTIDEIRRDFYFINRRATSLLTRLKEAEPAPASEEAVERAARAMHDLMWGSSGEGKESAWLQGRAQLIRHARAALAAAREG